MHNKKEREILKPTNFGIVKKYEKTAQRNKLSKYSGINKNWKDCFFRLLIQWVFVEIHVCFVRDAN